MNTEQRQELGPEMRQVFCEWTSAWLFVVSSLSDCVKFLQYQIERNRPLVTRRYFQQIFFSANCFATKPMPYRFLSYTLLEERSRCAVLEICHIDTLNIVSQHRRIPYGAMQPRHSISDYPGTMSISKAVFSSA